MSDGDIPSASGGADAEAYPAAEMRPVVDSEVGWAGHKWSRMWLVTAGCAVVAVVILMSAWRQRGVQVQVDFRDGHGIQPGNRVRLLGVDIGEVRAVRLVPEQERVRLTLELQPDAREIAREGTTFWIERPQWSLTRARGLETVVGAKYVGVQPGPTTGKRQTSFVGVEFPRGSSERGTTHIQVRLRRGHGIAPGAPLRYRGVPVGEVMSVQVTEDLRGIVVDAELAPSAARIACTGSQFWIERPQMSVAEVRGLDALVTGPYLAVVPGPAEAEASYEFDGLEGEPVDADEGGSVELILESPQRHGLQTGSPVTYRGITVGKVLHVGLSSDAASVETRVTIFSPYRQLVRANSQFWPTSGVEVQLGLLGLRVDAESLTSLAMGGVAVATPASLGEPIVAGHRFRLNDEPDPEWLNWEPHVPVGPHFASQQEPLPVPIRAAWTRSRRRWGLERRQVETAWAHCLAQGQLLLPRPVQKDLQDLQGVAMELAGRTVSLDPQRVHSDMHVARITGLAQWPARTYVWHPEQVRVPTKPEACILVAGTETIPIAESRLQGGTVWAVDTSLPLDASWHGAAAVARADAKLIGLVVWVDEQPSIAPLTAATGQDAARSSIEPAGSP